MIKHTLTSGQEIEITAREYCGTVEAETKINGKFFRGNLIPPKSQHPQMRKNLEAKGFPGYWMFDAICLPPGKAIEVQAMLTEAQAAIDATPEAQLRKNINIREDLRAKIRGCYADAQHAQDKSYESGDGTGRWVFAGDKFEAEVEKYRAELKDFEAAHPEVVAEIERRKERDHASFLASN